MSETEKTTLQTILAAAKDEFLEKGFRGASLRNIAKTANVTTGAFYGYYKSKEELFDALVSEQANHALSIYKKAQIDFASLPPDEQKKHIGDIPEKCMSDILEYAYKNLEEFKLILTCSGGTKYENFIHEMVEIEVNATHKFNDVLNGLGIKSKLMNPQLEHILISGMLTAYFEMIIHDMPIAQAHEYLRELREFYTAGWQKIMGF